MVLQRKFLQAHGTNISFDTGIGCNMAVVVRANGASFPAGLTPIPDRIIVDEGERGHMKCLPTCSVLE